MKKREQWEYRSVKTEAGALVDHCGAQLGTEGWELVSVVALPFGPGVVMAFFKRRRD